MFMDYAEFAKKYDLDANYVIAVLGVHSELTKHYDRSISPFWLYDESKVLEAVYHSLKNDREKAYKLFNLLDEKCSHILTCMEEVNEREYERVFGD